MKVMNLQPLDENWQLVLVVTSENACQLLQTIEDTKTRSFFHNAMILASDTPAIRSQLSGLILPVAYKLPPRIESGTYWASVVSTHEFIRHRTIFLQAGTRIPECWDARLVAAGQRAPTAFAVSPQCARHPILSAFGSTNYQPELSVDEIDQWLNDYVDGIEYSVPIILESCALLQGDYWRDRHSPIVNDRQLLEDMRANGGFALATDQVYVDDFNTKYCNDISDLPKAFLDAFSLRPPLSRVHHALTELSRRHESPTVIRCCLPVQLHIGHSWGGGLGRWMEDFIAADTVHNHLVLRSIGDLSGFGQKIALYRSTNMDVPIRVWILSEPIISINFTSFEYHGIIQELIEQHSVESLVISSLVGHTLDLLRTILPTTVVMHDFFPFCPALYATYGSPCVSCTTNELRSCAINNPRNSYFKFESYAHWLAIRQEFVHLITQQSITVITPSPSVIDRYRQLENKLLEKHIHVVAHGLDDKLIQSLKLASELPSSKTPPQARLKIVMLGRLTEEKGGELLGCIISQLTDFAEIHLLGTGDSGTKFSARRGIYIRQNYDKDELGILLRDIQPDIGMLLSTVPETFSYTLSELWAAGIPVLATRLGAFADRIEDAKNGWLVDPNAEAVLEKLCTLDADRKLLARAKRYVNCQHVRTATQMVDEYAAAMPNACVIPVSRYNLPRRSYRNPYIQDHYGQDTEALYINHQHSYRQVLAGFLMYTGRKVDQSPKLPIWMRGVLRGSLHWAARHLDP